MIARLTAAGVLALASSASAGLQFYDAFDYTAGEKLAPRTDTTGSPNPGQLNVAYNVNWRYAGAGGATNEAPGIGSGTLSYPGLPAAGGNSVAFDTSQIGSARIEIPGTSASSNTGSFFWSGLLRINDVNTLTSGASGMLLGGFNNTPGPGGLPSAVGATLLVRKDASDPEVNNRYQIGSSVNTAAASRFFAESAPQLAGDTVFVVAAYDYNSLTNDDVVRLWLNPNPADFGAGVAPPADVFGGLGSGAELSAVRTFNLRNVNSVGSADIQFDELRVGDSWSSVTPEPSALALLGFAATGLLRRRRR